MKKSDMKKILPKGYKNSKFEKNALSITQKSVEVSIRLEKSTCWEINFETETKPKTIIIIGIGIYDKYSSVIEQGYPIHIMEVSMNKKSEMTNLANHENVFHWENDDVQSIEETIIGKVVPWINWISNPGILIDYLKCLEATVIDCTEDVECNQFSSLLNSLEDYPVNVRKNVNGAIATLYEELGDYGSAIKYVKKHREFTISDFPVSCKVQSMIDAHDKKLKLINYGIKSLNENLKTESIN